MALASAQKERRIDKCGPIADRHRHGGCRRDAPAQRAASALEFWSALLEPARHSRMRFPSILNSAPREDVGRQARTSVRKGLSGESRRITTLRDEASSDSTAI